MWGGVGHVGMGCIMYGRGGSCRCGEDHVGALWVMQGWGGLCRGRWVM